MLELRPWLLHSHDHVWNKCLRKQPTPRLSGWHGWDDDHYVRNCRVNNFGILVFQLHHQSGRGLYFRALCVFFFFFPVNFVMGGGLHSDMGHLVVLSLLRRLRSGWWRVLLVEGVVFVRSWVGPVCDKAETAWKIQQNMVQSSSGRKIKNSIMCVPSILLQLGPIPPQLGPTCPTAKPFSPLLMILGLACVLTGFLPPLLRPLLTLFPSSLPHYIQWCLWPFLCGPAKMLNILSSLCWSIFEASLSF